MRYEELLLLNLCKNDLFDDVDYDLIDWDNLLEQSVLHRVPGVLFKCFSSNKNAPLYFRRVINSLYFQEQEKGNLKLQEFYNVLNHLTLNGIDPIVLKGVFLIPCVYKDPGIRRFADMDILVNLNDIQSCHDILSELGYIQGKYDSKKRKVKEYSPHLKKRYRDLLQHEAEYMKIENHLGNAIVLSVDVHTRLTTSFDSFSLPTNDLIKNKVNYYSTIFDQTYSHYRLGNSDFLIHLCVHNYWHTLSLKDIYEHRDHQLRSYMDIYRFINFHKIDWEDVIQKSQVYGVSNPVGYSLYYCDKILSGNIPLKIINTFDLDWIRNEGRKIHDRWLLNNIEDTLGHYNNEPHERLFITDRFEKAYNLCCGIENLKNSETKYYFDHFQEPIQ